MSKHQGRKPWRFPPSYAEPKPSPNGIKRGDIFFAILGPVSGSEQGGIRPVLILQNNRGNRFSPSTICAVISSSHKKIAKTLPTHVHLDSRKTQLDSYSVVMCEQIKTIDKSRLVSKAGHLDKKAMEDVEAAIRISLDMRP